MQMGTPDAGCVSANVKHARMSMSASPMLNVQMLIRLKNLGNASSNVHKGIHPTNVSHANCPTALLATPIL